MHSSGRGYDNDNIKRGYNNHNKWDYILQLEKAGDSYRVVDVYDVSGSRLESSDADEIKSNFIFKFFDESSYENKYQNPEIRYYETEPYKGLPAIVPFDVSKGWYASIKSTLPIGGAIRAYDDSGRVSSFYLCNVGTNGREDFNSGIGDDAC